MTHWIDSPDRQLRELASRLILVADSVSLRGSGAARFLFVVGNGCAAEVSVNGDRLWTEFWDSYDPEVEGINDATYEATYATTEEAVEALTERLTLNG